MKKYINLFVAAALVLAVIGLATSSNAWAGAVPGSQNLKADPKSGVANLLQNGPVTVTATGSYNVEGVCSFDVEYKGTGLQDKADARIPVEESKKVPFVGELNEKLIYPGCHIIHYKDNNVVKQADQKDGKWQVCFGVNPVLEVNIYYYLDKQFGTPSWQKLPTTVSAAGVACAPAEFSGVYMPAGRPPLAPITNGQGGLINPLPINTEGTVPVPPPFIHTTESGTYYAGGVCAMIINYKQQKLTDDIEIYFDTEDQAKVAMPENGGQLDLPGCKVTHYEDAQVKQQMTPEQGEWEICFAARPGKDMVIYFYPTDPAASTPVWTALDTTIKSGLACAPSAMVSGVYAPAEK